MFHFFFLSFFDSELVALILMSLFGYMQYFFGGAMSVFTTRSLLHALGVSRGSATSSAVAVNWVIKVYISSAALPHVYKFLTATWVYESMNRVLCTNSQSCTASGMSYVRIVRDRHSFTYAGWSRPDWEDAVCSPWQEI